MKIYMIRHGQTEWNASGRLQGQTDIPLNENGRELAVKVGEALKEIPFDRVISSPLLRSVETAQLVLRRNAGAAGEALRAWERKMAETKNAAGTAEEARRAGVIAVDDRIQEISFGSYEGYSVPTSALFAGDGKFAITDPDFHNFFDAPEKYIPPRGAESIAHLVERAGDFLRKLAQIKEGESGEETILISTHGAASRALLANIKHAEPKDFWHPGVPKNCAVSIAETKNGKWQLLEQDLIFY